MASMLDDTQRKTAELDARIGTLEKELEGCRKMINILHERMEQRHRATLVANCVKHNPFNSFPHYLPIPSVAKLATHIKQANGK